MAKPPANARWYPVPRHLKPAECRACHATIYFIDTPAGKKMPIDCDVDGGHEPHDLADGSGVSHFQTCPSADRFSRSNRRS